ncbi:MAG: hypothetical protein E6G53_00595 [Actinobacteria bacterium]|nr:MAG: hypothetical protein E6G53_00595 [Actinomycetota bacterium]
MHSSTTTPSGACSSGGWPSSTTRLGRIADRSWFKQSLSDVEGFEHVKVGKAYLFGERRPYERYRDLGINEQRA